MADLPWACGELCEEVTRTLAKAARSTTEVVHESNKALTTLDGAGWPELGELPRKILAPDVVPATEHPGQPAGSRPDRVLA